MHVAAGSDLRVLYSSILSMSRMVSANTVKGEICWHGVGENYNDLKKIQDPRCRVNIDPK